MGALPKPRPPGAVRRGQLSEVGAVGGLVQMNHMVFSCVRCAFKDLEEHFIFSATRVEIRNLCGNH